MTPQEQAARPSLGVSRYIAQAKRERDARERSRLVWLVAAGIVTALYLAALAGVLVGVI